MQLPRRDIGPIAEIGGDNGLSWQRLPEIVPGPIGVDRQAEPLAMELSYVPFKGPAANGDR